MTFMDLDERRRMEHALSEDRKAAFHIICRMDGLRATMIDCLERGVEKLEDEAYEKSSRGYTVYGFWIQDLAVRLQMEARQL